MPPALPTCLTLESMAWRPYVLALTPDTFLYAAKLLGVAPGRAFGVEDSLAGVEAIRAAEFGRSSALTGAGKKQRSLHTARIWWSRISVTSTRSKLTPSVCSTLTNRSCVSGRGGSTPSRA